MEKVIKRINMKDFVSSIIFLLAGFVLLWQALIIEDSDSAMFVLVILALYFSMTLMIMIKSIVSKGSEKYKRIYSYKVLGILLLLMGLRFGMDLIGFYMSVIPFIFIVNLICLSELSKKNIIHSVIFSTVFTGFLYLICEFGLSIAF